MNVKKISYILLAISFVMIISGGVSSFLMGLRTDKQMINKRMIDVSNEFEDFSTNTSLFETARDNLYEEILSNNWIVGNYVFKFLLYRKNCKYCFK